MPLPVVKYLMILRAYHRLEIAQRDYVTLMMSVGLDGARPHTFNDDTLEITPRESPDPPLVQPS